MRDFLVGFLDGFVSVYMQPDGTPRYFRAHSAGRVVGELSLNVVGGLALGLFAAWGIYTFLGILLTP